MMLIRPVQPSDLPYLVQLAQKAGTGLTTLPNDPKHLQKKIDDSIQAFKKPAQEPGTEYYLFVLENTEDGSIVGTSGLAAAVGLSDPFYTYKVSHTVNSSRGLDKYRHHHVLVLGNDYTGCTEICTLFLDPAFRRNNNGRLLSKCRFLFMAEFPDGFSPTIIAEMRGVSDENGTSPFWESLGRHFFDMDFAEADRLSGLGNSQFIADFMPKHPIYSALLSPQAQAVIGQVHQETKPALKMLLREGFHYRQYVDIFDAGPTIEADRENLHTVAQNKRCTLSKIGPSQSGQQALVANCQFDFRATLAKVDIQEDECQVDSETANLLQTNPGDPLRIYSI